jgi:hypothetical protein
VRRCSAAYTGPLSSLRLAGDLSLPDDFCTAAIDTAAPQHRSARYCARDVAPIAAVAVGLILVGWISIEMMVLAGLGSLVWALYLVVGVCIAAIGVTGWRSAAG